MSDIFSSIWRLKYILISKLRFYLFYFLSKEKLLWSIFESFFLEIIIACQKRIFFVEEVLKLVIKIILYTFALNLIHKLAFDGLLVLMFFDHELFFLHLIVVSVLLVVTSVVIFVGVKHLLYLLKFLENSELFRMLLIFYHIWVLFQVF